jgi:hypothetical protein
VRLVVVRTTIIIVPFLTLFLLLTLSISSLAFDSAVCITGVDDVVYITGVSVVSSDTLPMCSDAAGRVPTKTLPVVTVMTPVTALLVVDRILYHRHVQHCLEPLNMRIDLFIILGEMGGDLVDQDP